MEGTDLTHNTKISDSAYSNSCSNSQSQRSGSSSKSRQSNSSGSSGYGGEPPTTNAVPQPLSKRSKDRKKKKLKSTIQACTSTIDADFHTKTAQETKSTECVEKIEEDKVEDQEKVAKILLTECPALVLLPIKKTIEDIASPLSVVVFESQPISVEQPQSTAKTEKGSSEEGFCCVMSMHDGVVLYTTPSITNGLGFPRDMWLGRSFIDFVHPKDRPTFASQITSGVALAEARNSSFKDTKHSLYVMLRRYRGLKSGYGVTNKSVTYEAFKLSLTFREAPSDDSFCASDVITTPSPCVNSSMLLVISATPVKSVFKTHDEVFTVAQRDQTKFTTRHTASGLLSHVDGTANILGFLPQDMLGRKVMEFYHPEDMVLLKEVYETIMAKGQTAGASFCGKPYRFLSHNGCFITIETVWSSFVNPWSHHLEFVVGYHKVLKGPSKPNVLAPKGPESQAFFTENVLSESKSVQEEILKLLNETVTRPSDRVKQQVSKRCQVLASFMETLTDEVTNSKLKGGLTLDLPLEVDLTFSDRDSVMLGEISPHHDYFDSKSSSETPPSYNQLNYSENLQRFFDSRPVTAKPDQMKLEQTDTEPETRENSSPMQCFGESGGSESAGNMSSVSNANMESVTNTSTGTSDCSYVPPTLTEALLCKHNENMEKLIIKRHKVSRTIGKNEKKQKVIEKSHEHHSHGLKRSGSHSWEGEAHKTSKYLHVVKTQKTHVPLITTQTSTPSPNADLWPPFSVGMTPMQNTHTSAQSSHFTTSNMFPTLYYVSQPNMTPQDQRSPIQPMQYMPSVLYQPVYPHPSNFIQMQYSPISSQLNLNDSLYSSAFQFERSNMAMPLLQKIPMPNVSGSFIQSMMQRPASQATAVKADMGSTPASVVNRALSESSRKCGVFNSPQGNGDANEANNQRMEKASGNTTGTSEDESSYLSFYSSFLKTDEGPTSSNEGHVERNDKEMDCSLATKTLLRRPNPQWLDNVDVTNEFVYRYQINAKALNDVLKTDLYALKHSHQPDLVNDQLDQLYVDLQNLKELSAKFSLESSASSSGEEETLLKPTRKIQNSKLVLICEENCPFPADLLSVVIH
uniref:Period circadian protein n=1 Tax=Belgica antarctica TaxID=315563 RepID=U5YD03_9DIPT|nr:PERIOD [Belgica antarctica]